MAKFDDLPNELLDRIVETLVRSSSKKRSRKDLVNLILVSRRCCDRARPELYRTAIFKYGTKFVQYFLASGITSVPAGTLKRIDMNPYGGESFIGLEKVYNAAVKRAADTNPAKTLAAQLERFCTGVEHWELNFNCEYGDVVDCDPNNYMPMYQAMDPITLIFGPHVSPVDFRDCQESVPVIKLSKVISLFSGYTRLAKFQMPCVAVDKLSQEHRTILSRLPIQHFRLDWPSGLTAAKLLELLVNMPNLKPGGLIISCDMSGMECAGEFYNGRMDEGERPTLVDFRKKNGGLTLEEVQKYCKAKNKADLLEKLTWIEPSEDEYTGQHDDDG